MKQAKGREVSRRIDEIAAERRKIEGRARTALTDLRQKAERASTWVDANWHVHRAQAALAWQPTTFNRVVSGRVSFVLVCTCGEMRWSDSIETQG